MSRNIPALNTAQTIDAMAGVVRTGLARDDEAGRAALEWILQNLELRVQDQTAGNGGEVLAGPDCRDAVSEGNQADYPAPPTHAAIGNLGG